MAGEIFDKSTIGSILKAKRLEKDLSIEEVHHITKITIDQLEDIESNHFHKFSSDIQAKGFIRNYSEILGINHETLWAIYRRDIDLIHKARNRYVGKSEVFENPDKYTNIKIWLNKFRITKKVIYLLLFLIVFTTTLIFAVNVIQSALKPPELSISFPIEISGEYKGKMIYNANTVLIEGKTEKNTIVKVNGQVILLNPDNSFKTDELATGSSENIITIEAENNFNRTTKIILNLAKSKKVFDNLNLRIVGINSGTNLRVKVDGIFRFDKKLEPGKIFTYEGINEIEIIPERKGDLLIFLNSEEYTILKSKLIFQKKENNFFIIQE